MNWPGHVMRTDFPSQNVNVNVRYFSNVEAHVLSVCVYNQLQQTMREQRETMASVVFSLYVYH